MITNEEYMRIAEQVKTIMEMLSININDKDVAELEIAGEEMFGDSEYLAVYSPEHHKVFVNSNKMGHILLDSTVLPELLAHELTHSFQFLPSHFEMDVFSEAYWEQAHEREAYSVGTTWQAMFGEAKDTLLETGVTLKDHYVKMIEDNDREDVLSHLTNVVFNIFKTQHNLI